jgi:hypothetical protein
MMRIEGTWFISVSVHAEAKPDNNHTMTHGVVTANPSIPFVLNATRVHDTDSGDQSFCSDQISGLADAIEGTFEPKSHANQLVDVVFTIKVVKNALDGSRSDPIEFTRNFSEICWLHMTLSESLSRVPQCTFESAIAVELGALDDTPSASRNRSLCLENMLTRGRILGDLLEFMQTNSGTYHQETASNYSGKIPINASTVLSISC